MVADGYIPVYDSGSVDLLLRFCLMFIEDQIPEISYIELIEEEGSHSKEGDIEPVNNKNEYRRKYKYLRNLLQKEIFRRDEIRFKRCRKTIISESGAPRCKKPKIKEYICKRKCRRFSQVAQRNIV